MRERFATRAKGKLFLRDIGCALGDRSSLGLICQQTLCNFDQLGVATFFATRFRKRDPLNRAIAAHANRAGEESIARYLPGNTAAIELENNFMTRDFAQIGAIVHPFFVHPNFSKAHFANELRLATPTEIENRHRLFGHIAQPFYSDEGSEMIPRRYCELTCSDKNSLTIFDFFNSASARSLARKSPRKSSRTGHSVAIARFVSRKTAPCVHAA